MNKILSLVLATSLFACGGDEEANQQEAEQQAEAIANQLGQAMEQATAEAEAAEPAAAPGESNFGTITLAPGFTPDPSTATGTSGGSTDASTLSPGCAGNISATPDHLLVAGGQFTNLRVMTKSEGDTTLVIQAPDGSYRCDDDTEDMNPLVEGAFAPGTYKIWVGSYNEGEPSPYTLGISELANVVPSSL